MRFSEQLYVAGVAIQHSQTQIKKQAAVAAVEGLGRIGMGAAKMFGGRTLTGLGEGLMSGGKFLATRPTTIGAVTGGTLGGMFGPNEDHSWGGFARNVGVGALAGGTAGHFGGAGLSNLLTRGGEALSGGTGAINAARYGAGLEPVAPGIGQRLVDSGWSNVAKGNMEAPSGPMGAIARWATPGKMDAGTKIPGRVIGGMTSLPFFAGSLMGQGQGMGEGAQLGANQAQLRMAQAMHDLTPMQRLGMAWDPKGSVYKQLSPEIQKQLDAMYGGSYTT